ncbi:hypothetical protein PoB_005608100 [Plakobranchus ocellatus]|uniref:Uncharacterized protein n=1 Tax=Plakobranchus ocellatus TaxID=259542 RepID=A0AAV4C2J0_9GAST|nr:hypothetical protein PoB_005608100 [Plakobranchus ocellatus]
MLFRGQSSTVTIHCQLSRPLSRSTASSVFHCDDALPRSVFHCHDALIDQSSIVTMHCSVSLPLSRCTARSVFHRHDSCLSVLYCHDALL